jgi:hypothetical protein
LRNDLFRNPDLFQNMHSVGRDLHSAADIARLRMRLEHRRLDARLVQKDGERRPGNPSTCDQNLSFSRLPPPRAGK